MMIPIIHLLFLTYARNLELLAVSRGVGITVVSSDGKALAGLGLVQDIERYSMIE